MLLNTIPCVGQRIVQSISSVRVERRCSSVARRGPRKQRGLLEALGHWPHCSHEDGESALPGLLEGTQVICSVVHVSCVIAL